MTGKNDGRGIKIQEMRETVGTLQSKFGALKCTANYIKIPKWVKFHLPHPGLIAATPVQW